MKHSKIQKEKGITLIALVVTIVVLLILAGISINFVLGEGGILDMAKLAAKGTEDAIQSDLEGMQNLENVIGDIVNNGWSISKVTAVTSADGKIVPVPKGFVGSNANGENTVSGGFVIYEGTSAVTNENVEQAKTTRNQFVWIPVDGENLKYEQDKTSWGGNSYYTNYADWTDDENIDFRKESVKTYGGFYVGRYEAGLPGSEKYEDESPYLANEETMNISSGTIAVKKGLKAWNFINQINAKSLSNQMYQNNESIQSSLMDSYAWDTMTKWLANNNIDVMNSSSWGSIKGRTGEKFEIDGLYAIHTYENNEVTIAKVYNKGKYVVEEKAGNVEVIELSTGITDRNCKQNIYDLAGNLNEYTTEIGNAEVPGWEGQTLGVPRGASFVDGGKVGQRFSLTGIDTTTLSAIFKKGFRPVLYINK